MDPTNPQAAGRRHVLFLAPLIFVAHFLEEGEGFVTWFNAHVPRGITPELFWTVNFTALAITVAVVVLGWVAESEISDLLLVAWFSFLFGANALLHITATIADGAPMPGIYTAIALYLPFYIWLLWRVDRTRRIWRVAIATVALLAAFPMLLHGYLIIFRGSRLF